MLNLLTLLADMTTVDAVKLFFDLFYSMAASCFILLMFVPQFLFVYRTKNTAGLNKSMFCLHTSVACLYFINSVLVLCDPGIQSAAHLVGKMIVFLALNLFVSALSIYMIWLKVTHVKAAAKLNISEFEHYNKYILPTLNKTK